MAKSKRSSGAVARAWAIFSKHPKNRAEALAAAAKAGINPHTAATQWQRFTHSTPKQRTEKVNGTKKSEKKQEVAAQ